MEYFDLYSFHINLYIFKFEGQICNMGQPLLRFVSWWIIFVENILLSDDNIFVF